MGGTTILGVAARERIQCLRRFALRPTPATKLKRTPMTKLLKDPLVHFLLAGAVLFVLFYWRGDAGTAVEQRIVIDAEQVERLSQAAALLRGRPLASEELAAVVAPAIRDEVMYREALALGLDVDDDQVRDRLIEKMQYLSQDLVDPEPASDEQLRAFFDASRELFRIPETVTFDQIFFSPRERGESVQADVESALAALRGGQSDAGLGDRTPLQNRFVDAPRDRVAVLFGEALTDAVFSMTPGEWSGPYESDFGLHLVRTVERRAARQPTFDEVGEQARQVYAQQRREEANEAAYAQMLERYEVMVEWPEPEAAL